MTNKQKTRYGRVVSDKMDRTVVVAVDTPKHHRVYKKTIRRIVKYYADDEKRQCKTGDIVRIEESRPISKLKRWRVVEIITKGEVADIKPQEITDEGTVEAP